MNLPLPLLLLLAGLFGLMAFLPGQGVYLSEASSANVDLRDEDGRFSDWLELHNASVATVDLSGWALTDDLTQRDKWRFERTVLPANGYLKVWASGSNRPRTSLPRTLIVPGDTVRYVVPDEDTPTFWFAPDFDDGEWLSGPAGIGYGDDDDATLVPEGTVSVFFRKRFYLEDAAAVEDLMLHLDYDDGFVAFLNGVEIARSNFYEVRVAYDRLAAQRYEPALPQGLEVPRFPVSDFRQLLRDGENVLAVQVHNFWEGSSDLSATPFLTAYLPEGEDVGVPAPALLGLAPRCLHTNFKLATTGETLYLFNAAGVLVDSLACPPLPPGTSVGRAFGERTGASYFDQPTPGAANPPEGGYTGASTSQVVFSRPGGSTSPFRLTLGGAGPGEVIRFTLDASTPTADSPLYVAPLEIDTTTVVRARVFAEGRLPSATVSQTYLIGVGHELPTLCLVTDAKHLFDQQEGIYTLGPGDHGTYPYFSANIWKDWERPVQLSFREPDGVAGGDFSGGVKIFGGFSRALAQRSLSLFARSAYGSEAFGYPFFPSRPYASYQSLIARNSGNDWLNTMLRDGALTGLFRDADLEVQAYRPVATYLNGAYWGIYNLREKINEHYLASQSGVETDQINLLEKGGEIIHGSRSGYRELIDFVREKDLSREENYRRLAREVDVENFILYNVAQIYFNNTDWPGNNVKYWKPDDGRWRWVLFDTDFGFGLFNDSDYAFNNLRRTINATAPGWPGQLYATHLLREALDNLTFRHAFINCFADQMNSRLLSERVNVHLDTLAEVISSEVRDHFNRWDRNPARWAPAIDRMKRFGERRPAAMKAHLLEQFELTDYFPITIANPSPEFGYVTLNSLTITDAEWTGDYFDGVPITLKAVARPGFRFVEWTGSITANNAEIEVDPFGPLTLTPVFKVFEDEVLPPVINEIHYASDPTSDVGDWLELYNPNATAVVLDGWTVKDDDDDHSFVLPSGTTLGAQDYLVLTRGVRKFATVHPGVRNAIGSLNYGLGAGGDAVRLFDTAGIVRDEVYYDNQSPWPTEFMGADRTIGLKDPTTDNALGEHWSSDGWATPGRENFNTLAGGGRSLPIDAELSLQPNPTTGRVTIRLALPSSMMLEVALFDLAGRHLRSLKTGRFAAGFNELMADLGDLPTGTYLLHLITMSGDRQLTRRVVKY